MLLLDVDLRHASMAQWSVARWGNYALGELATGAVLLLLRWACLGLARKRPALASVALGFSSALLGVWLIAALVTRSVMGAYPTWSDLAFVFYEGRHFAETWGLLSGYLTPAVLGAMLALSLACAYTLRREARATRPLPGRRAQLMVAAALVALIAVRARVDDTVALSPASSLLVSSVQLAGYAMRRTRGDLHAAQRRPPPALPRQGPRPHVLLIVEESLSRKHMSLYGHARDTTPELLRWQQTHGEPLFVFERATANASNTSISLPTLLTGLCPDASWADFHDQPLAWQYARAAGYATFMLSAQSFRYAGFDAYFLSSPPDQTFTAEPGKAELVNGGGMDDELLEPRLHAALEHALASGKPFFGVVQFNATHHPFLARPADLAQLGDSRLGRYESAIRVVDRVLVRTLEWLRTRGALDHTLVLVTSDHGETHGEHAPHRTQSYYDEVTSVPLLVHLPASLRRARPDAARALDENRTRRVQNLDLLPTALDAIGVLDAPELAPFRKRFGGHSLLAEVARDRTVLVMNNNAIRTWANEGFGLVRDQHKYIFSERDGDALYDLTTDPQEQHNLWSAKSRPGWWDAALRDHPSLCALRARHCEPHSGCVAVACR